MLSKWYGLEIKNELSLRLELVSPVLDKHTQVEDTCGVKVIGWLVISFYDISTHFGSFNTKLRHFQKSFKQFSQILKKNQNGFWRNRSTTSQILTIRRILEGV